jgi:hypothetical protein
MDANNPKDYRFQRILQEAAAYRTLREVFDAMPDERHSADQIARVGRDLERDGK